MAPSQSKTRPAQISIARLQGLCDQGPLHFERRGNRYIMGGGGLTREFTGVSLVACIDAWRASTAKSSTTTQTASRSRSAARSGARA